MYDYLKNIFIPTWLEDSSISLICSCYVQFYCKLFIFLPIRLCCSFWFCVRSRKENNCWRSCTGFPWATSWGSETFRKTTVNHLHIKTQISLLKGQFPPKLLFCLYLLTLVLFQIVLHLILGWTSQNDFRRTSAVKYPFSGFH